MKRLFSLLLVLCLLLAGCGGKADVQPATTEAPVTEDPTEATTEATVPKTTEAPTEAPTEASTEPVQVSDPAMINPLTGETLEEPCNTRIFAVTINNVPPALPHYGVGDADLFFEMFVNGLATRGLALYADMTKVNSVGSVRSMRMNFTDICQAYDAIPVYAGGSSLILGDLSASGIKGISVESEAADYYFRDDSRLDAGYAWEHVLFVKGAETVKYAEKKGIRVTRDSEKDFGLDFTENGMPEGGEAAATVTIDMRYGSVTKTNKMIYNADTGLYIYNQYGSDMKDGITGQKEGFKNVIVMLCDVYNIEQYHVATLIGSGNGYFACDGQLVEIQWTRENDSDPFHYTLTDGTPLELGIGSSYICFAPKQSDVRWE